MKSFIIIITVLTSAYANPLDHFHTWSPPGPNDVRAPCPMLNALANHGFSPHSGKDIDLNTTIAAFGTALNGDPLLATMLFNTALKANLATPDPTTFSLNDLDHHNIIEHDASLSETVTIQMAANARAARIATSNATNPTFNLTYIANQGFQEPAAYFLVLGNYTTHTVNRSFVEYLFEHERLPLELGWRPSATLLTVEEFLNTTDLIVAASPPDVKAGASKTKRVMHGF